MQHDLQEIYEGQKCSSESLKLTVSLFEDSNVPKADVVCSVIAAETIPPTLHATYVNSVSAYLQVQRPGSNRLRFSSDKRYVATHFN